MSEILFISSDYKPRPGGVAEYLDNLARGLIRSGRTVRVLAVVQAHEIEQIKFLENYEGWVSLFPIVYEKRPQNWLVNKSVSVFEIMRCLSSAANQLLDKSPVFRPSALAVAQFKDVLAKENPKEIIFGYLDVRLYPLFLFLIERRLPYGVIAHDVEVYRSGGKANDLIKRGMMLEKASWIVANSRHTKELLEAWGTLNEKIKIVHPPLSEEAIRQAARDSPETADRDFTLVTIARLVKSKGIDTVLHALKILGERGMPYRYLIAGDGPERKSLQELANDLGLTDRVQFLGYVNDQEKWTLLRQTDLFVMTSRVSPHSSHEGFGLAFLEAAACGVPAVGSRAGGIPEAVVHGETGLLVPQESPKSLADAISFFYENPDSRRTMGKSGMQRAISQFSSTAIAEYFQKEVLRPI